MYEYKKYTENIKDQLGDKWLDSKKVFTSDEGGPIHPDVPRKIFRRVLEKYKLPIIRFHDLRHTSASLQLSSGANIADISKNLVIVIYLLLLIFILILSILVTK